MEYEFTSTDSNFIELYSEEAGYQTTDPKVVIYYRYETTNNDTIISDTTFRTIYSASDISIIKLNQDLVETNELCISNGLGIRAKLFANIDDDFIPSGSLIKSANLSIPIDSLKSDINLNLILDPIKVIHPKPILILSTKKIHLNPMVFPYRTSNLTNGSSYTVSIKYFRIFILEMFINLGFKIIADENNNPFESTWIKVSENLKPKIKIILC